MAIRAHNISLTDSQSLGVTAVAQAVRGGPSVFRISIPSQTGSTLVMVRKSTLSGFVEAAIDALDATDGDENLEDDDPEEEDGSRWDSAWLEQLDQSAPPMAMRNVWAPFNEDDEEDDPHGDVTEDDPAFDPLSRIIANMSAHGHAGCKISDDDHDPYY